MTESYLDGMHLRRGNEYTYYGNGSVSERGFDLNGKPILWRVNGREVSEREFNAWERRDEARPTNQFVVSWSDTPKSSKIAP